MALIFIAYRRGPSEDAVYRIRDQISRHFGDHDVFIDIDNIPVGVRYADHLAATVESCKVVLVIIGKGWAPERLHDPTDTLRHELEVALAHRAALIPVLVQGADLPKAQDLPETLRPLIAFQAIEVESGRFFRANVSELIAGIQRHLEERTRTRPQAAAAPAGVAPEGAASAPSLAGPSPAFESNAFESPVLESPESASASGKRFRIAFSFSGEKREFVGQVAQLLAERFGQEAILYDKFHEAEFARRDLGFRLPDLYHDESDLIVVVVCDDYESKEWCGMEWAAIFDLLKQRRDKDVMLCRFDHASVQGIYTTGGFFELDNVAPAGMVTRILERLALNEGKQRNHYLLRLLSGGPLLEAPSPPARGWVGRTVTRHMPVAALFVLSTLLAGVASKVHDRWVRGKPQPFPQEQARDAGLPPPIPSTGDSPPAKVVVVCPASLPDVGQRVAAQAGELRFDRAQGPPFLRSIQQLCPPGHDPSEPDIDDPDLRDAVGGVSTNPFFDVRVETNSKSGERRVTLRLTSRDPLDVEFRLLGPTCQALRTMSVRVARGGSSPPLLLRGLPVLDCHVTVPLPAWSWKHQLVLNFAPGRYETSSLRFEGKPLFSVTPQPRPDSPPPQRPQQKCSEQKCTELATRGLLKPSDCEGLGGGPRQTCERNVDQWARCQCIERGPR